MKLIEAQLLHPGRRVFCPPDRGTPGYTGLVVDVGKNVQHHAMVKEGYLWVTVRHPGGTQHVWPSNRLGRL